MLISHKRCEESERRLLIRISDLEERESLLLERIEQMQTARLEMEKSLLDRLMMLSNPIVARAVAARENGQDRAATPAEAVDRPVQEDPKATAARRRHEPADKRPVLSPQDAEYLQFRKQRPTAVPLRASAPAPNEAVPALPIETMTAKGPGL